MQQYTINITGQQTTTNIVTALRLIANAIEKVQNTTDANKITGGEYDDCCLLLDIKPTPEFEPIEFTRVSSDGNGNPRYACWYGAFITENDRNTIPLDNRYSVALTRAKKLGGGKFNNKQFGGGIVFQSYNIEDTEKKIHEFMKQYA